MKPRKRTRRTFLATFVVTLLVTSATLTTSACQHHYCHSPVAFVFRRIPPLEGELGSSPTLSRILGRDNYYFDPFELASDENFARFRESELKHGRVAMVATIGMIAPSIVLGNDKWTAFNVVKSMTWAQYAQIMLTCAFLEAFVFVQQDSRDMPGDYATGYFGIRDKGLNERSMISELENGRLAMMAFVVQLMLEIVTKKSIVGQWEDVLAAIANARK